MRAARFPYTTLALEPPAQEAALPVCHGCQPLIGFMFTWSMLSVQHASAGTNGSYCNLPVWHACQWNLVPMHEGSTAPNRFSGSLGFAWRSDLPFAPTLWHRVGVRASRSSGKLHSVQ